MPGSEAFFFVHTFRTVYRSGVTQKLRFAIHMSSSLDERGEGSVFSERADGVGVRAVFECVGDCALRVSVGDCALFAGGRGPFFLDRCALCV